ncbi:hypothetical protein EI94DRAFT_1733482 [Lactarius quietus]|nr:hypothetical protein EI94DRAFT_1733482 [Lactarius quietus]
MPVLEILCLEHCLPVFFPAFSARTMSLPRHASLSTRRHTTVPHQQRRASRPHTLVQHQRRPHGTHADRVARIPNADGHTGLRARLRAHSVTQRAPRLRMGRAIPTWSATRGYARGERRGAMRVGERAAMGGEATRRKGGHESGKGDAAGPRRASVRRGSRRVGGPGRGEREEGERRGEGPGRTGLRTKARTKKGG